MMQTNIEDRANKKTFAFTFSYELDDLLKAHSAQKKVRSSHRMGQFFKVLLVAATGVVLIDCILLFVISVLLRHLSGNPVVDDLVRIGAIMLAIFSILLVISILMLDDTASRWRIKRSYLKNQTGDVDYEIIVDSEGLQANISDWKTWLGWSRVQGVYAYKNGFLFFTGNEDYLTIPNRIFEDNTQIEAFKDLIVKAIDGPVHEIE